MSIKKVIMKMRELESNKMQWAAFSFTAGGDDFHGFEEAGHCVDGNVISAPARTIGGYGRGPDTALRQIINSPDCLDGVLEEIVPPGGCLNRIGNAGSQGCMLLILEEMPEVRVVTAAWEAGTSETCSFSVPAGFSGAIVQYINTDELYREIKFTDAADLFSKINAVAPNWEGGDFTFKATRAGVSDLQWEDNICGYTRDHNIENLVADILKNEASGLVRILPWNDMQSCDTNAIKVFGCITIARKAIPEFIDCEVSLHNRTINHFLEEGFIGVKMTLVTEEGVSHQASFSPHPA
jgi:hypothetical protein